MLYVSSNELKSVVQLKTLQTISRWIVYAIQGSNSIENFSTTRFYKKNLPYLVPFCVHSTSCSKRKLALPNKKLAYNRTRPLSSFYHQVTQKSKDETKILAKHNFSLFSISRWIFVYLPIFTYAQRLGQTQQKYSFRTIKKLFRWSEKE